MTAEAGSAQASPPPSLGELAGMIREVTGESDQWAAAIGPACRLEDDLQLESVDLTALGELVQRRYGAGVELSGYLAGLDFDQLIELTVGDLLSFLTAAAARSREPAR